jgi:MFS family permease
MDTQTFPSDAQNKGPYEQLEGERKYLGFLSLTRTTSSLNLWSYVIASLFSISFLVFINAAQGYVLADLLNVPTEELGNTSGSLAFYDQLLSIVMVYVWGFLSDKFPLQGRRVVFTLGFGFIAIALFLFPNMPNVYPALLIARLIFALGASACTTMLTAILADFAGESARGKLAGFMGAMTGLGAIISLFVFLRLPASLGLYTSFYIVGGIAIACMLLTLFGLTPTQAKKDYIQELRITSNRGVIETKRPLHLLAWDAVVACKDPRVVLGYMGGFLARGDSSSITLFLPLFYAAYYLSNGLCPSTGTPGDEDWIKENCRDAYLKSSTMGGIAQTVALVSSLAWGFLSDVKKMHRSVSFLIASIFGAIGYIGLMFATDPRKSMVYLWIILIGLAEGGMITISLALITDSEYIPRDSRGSIAGMYSLIGAIGVLVATKVGGILFDIRYALAFAPMGAGHVIACILAVGVIIWWYTSGVKKQAIATKSNPFKDSETTIETTSDTSQNPDFA